MHSIPAPKMTDSKVAIFSTQLRYIYPSSAGSLQNVLYCFTFRQFVVSSSIKSYKTYTQMHSVVYRMSSVGSLSKMPNKNEISIAILL